MSRVYQCGRLGQSGALGRVAEFAGSYVSAMSMDMRFTLCNMGTEMGAVSSYIQPDAITLDWVKPRAKKAFRVYETDADFAYDGTHEIDVSDIEPQVAVPHAPDNVKPVGEVAGRHIDQAYLGSCASGRLEDLAAAAAVLKGRKVHPDVRLIVTAGSREVLIAATRAGYVDVLHAANAIVTNANCGACPGLHGGILAPGEVAISSNTRNTNGRMGRGAEIYLASPATVAASAIEGCIANPAQVSVNLEKTFNARFFSIPLRSAQGRKEIQNLDANMKFTYPARIVTQCFPLRSSANFASLRLIAVLWM